jgi:hypothetical protein
MLGMAKQKLILKVLVSSLSIASSVSYGASAGYAVGSGIVFPTLGSSMITNPAGLAEGPKASIGGDYALSEQDIFGSATVAQNGFGAGFAYTRLDATSSSREALGAGAKLGPAMLGASMNSTEFSNFTFDAGAIIDLKGLAFGVVARGLTDSLSAYSLGAGFSQGNWGAELDVTKYSSGVALADDPWRFHAGAFLNIQKLSLGAGYDFTMTGSEFDFGDDFSAAASFMVTNSIALEAGYKVFGDWSVGARFRL